MKLVFYSIVLNHHQAPIADTLYGLLGDDYMFVETSNISDAKGAAEDYSKRPYLLCAWESKSAYAKAMVLAQTAESCVFSGVQALPFQKERMKLGLLSFDMSERWLKRGFLNLFSPSILKMFVAYHLGGWHKKPLYKLCCSAFAAADQRRLQTYRNRCYKWGYFTRVEKNVETFRVNDTSTNAAGTPMMWCARYLMWKHPELPILMAARLRAEGYRFTLDMYGSGEYEGQSYRLVNDLGINDIVRFMGTKTNEELTADMRSYNICLFTSDRNEGWGAVANESMANGCALVASDGIGSSPYLIENGTSGLLFKSPKTSSNFDNPDMEALDSLCEKVKFLLDYPQELQKIRCQSVTLMQEVWSPQVAADRLLALIDCLRNEKETPFVEGPCSKA